MILVETTPPYALPVHLNEAKLACRVDPDLTDEDDLITGMIAAATQVAATYHRQQVVSATWTMYCDGFYTQPMPGGQEWPYSAYATSVDMIPIAAPAFRPNAIMRIPFGPVQQVVSITYVDAAGVTQTLDPSVYQVDLQSPTTRILPAYAQFWPYTRPTTNAVVVTINTGIATPFTVSGSTLTLQGGAAPVNGTRVRLCNSGGAPDAGLPDPLKTFTDYYIIGASGQTCQLSLTSGGSAITLDTSPGGGTSFIGVVPAGIALGIKQLVAHWYRTREGVSNLRQAPVPMAVEQLLLSERKVQYC